MVEISLESIEQSCFSDVCTSMPLRRADPELGAILASFLIA